MGRRSALVGKHGPPQSYWSFHIYSPTLKLDGVLDRVPSLMDLKIPLSNRHHSKKSS